MSPRSSHSCSGATALSRVSNNVSRLEPWKPIRIPKAEHWRSAVSPEESNRRHTRTDSKFEPRSSISPTNTATSHGKQSYITALPASVRTAIYRHILTQDAPIKPNETTSISHEATPPPLIPLALAFPLLEAETAQNVPYYLRHNTFTFDLRTEQGLLSFQAWTATFAGHAWNVRSLTLKHWTAYWGLSQNRWIALEDATNLSYGANGDLPASRLTATPKNSTCSCRSVLPLLARFDRRLDPRLFQTLANVHQFVACMRSRERRPERLALVNAGKMFTAMRDGHSRLLAKVYGLAGDDCSGCNMPRLYLCGRLSTGKENGFSRGVFDAKAPCKFGLQ